MRFLREVLHAKIPFSCLATAILLMLSRSKGEIWVDNRTVCEFQDAYLLFPNSPPGFNVKAKRWYKEKGGTLASMEQTNFKPYSLYLDRLEEIGENGIKIQNVTRNDTGTYILSLNSGSSQKLFELHLDVLVPPTSQCIPKIIHEGNSLMPELPPDVCGIPMMTSKWKNMTENIRILEFKSGLMPGIYIVCAHGKSLQCFQGDVNRLCSNYTVSEAQTENQSIFLPGGIVAAIIISIVLVMVVIALVCWKKIFIRRERQTIVLTETGTVENNDDEGNALMGEESSTTVVQAMKEHLIKQYKSMTHVPISPCYEENFEDISKLYCDLDIISLGEDVEDMEFIKPTVASYKEILCGGDKNVADKDCPMPALILGECGSGKSSWCKNLLMKWCQYHDTNKVRLTENDLDVPELAQFDILLYVTVQKNDKGLSLLDFVKHTLFYNAADYFENIINPNNQFMTSILLLIDGFDEVPCDLEPCLNLLRQNRQCSIVIMSRPSGFDCLHLKPLRIFQIEGFSPNSCKEFATKVLVIHSERRAEKLNVDRFWKFARHVQVLSMCHVPLLCLSLIMFWMENKALSVDLTDILFTVIEYYLRHAMSRKKKWQEIISQMSEQQSFDISSFIVKSKDKQILRDHSYLLKIMSSVAEKLWYSQMQGIYDKNSAESELNTIESAVDVELCLEIGILKKTFRKKMERNRSQTAFIHPLFFDFFVASSIAFEKQDFCTQNMTSVTDVVKNSSVIHMLCQLAPDTGQEIIKDLSELKLFDEKGQMLPDQKTIICNIECRNPQTQLQGGAPVNWLHKLMSTGELSSEKLSILTEGLKFTQELTVFVLESHENKNECIFQVPILSKLQALKVDIENCTLLLHEEREWNKVKFSELEKFVIKSVKIDVRLAGYLVEALGSCQKLMTLELCPKVGVDEEIIALDNQKVFSQWGRLANGITKMTKLCKVRLHNLTIGSHLSTLIDSLCKSKRLEILDLLNLKETDTEVATFKTSDRLYCECMHHKVQNLDYLESSNKSSSNLKTVQVTKNAMSKKSWKMLIEQLETLSPCILHIDQVYQSHSIHSKLFESIGRCKNLTILSICCIHDENDLVGLSGLKGLKKLEKLTLCKITLPDASWKELYEIINKLTKLKEISLAHLETKTCFIKVEKLSLMLLEVKEIELEESLWIMLANQLISLPKLKTLQLNSCKMSIKGYSHFYDAMHNSSFHIKNLHASKFGESEMLSVDVVLTSDNTSQVK